MAMTLLEMRAQFQDPMRQGIVDLLWQNSRLMRLVHFIQNAGLVYNYSATAKLPGVGFRNLNEDFTATAGVTNPKAENLTILGGKIRTDSVLIATKGDAARSNQITKQLIAAAKMFDRVFLNGDPTTDPKAFYGLKKRLSGAQLLTNATNGAIISVDNVVALQDAVQGSNAQKVLLMNQTNRRNLVTACTNTANMNLARYLEYVGEGENRQLYFNGSRVEEVFYDEAESAILPFTETCGNNSLSSSVYCVKFGGATDEEDVQGLSGLPGDIQSKGPFDYGTYVEDICQMVAGIAIFGGYSAARLQGVKAS